MKNFQVRGVSSIALMFILLMSRVISRCISMGRRHVRCHDDCHKEHNSTRTHHILVFCNSHRNNHQIVVKLY
ncbi:hypothetical protein TanjilG_27976 [Lupinus angustifolius]|uniref:Secreted protein n=1 Tax=Lupinus angustifolius TaxID=3871 RepID=A0A4P1RGC1_LUPAN|nr:hypothetical protein TanjilG_27976 [Lupinus angustifolius]